MDANWAFKSDNAGCRSSLPLLISSMLIHFRPGYRRLIYVTELRLVIIIEHHVIIYML